MTYLQIIVGGEPIPEEVIRQVGGQRICSDDIADWNPPPVVPENPNRGPGFPGLPAHVRYPLIKGSEKRLSELYGLPVRIGAVDAE